jgi:hypothetical protein
MKKEYKKNYYILFFLYVILFTSFAFHLSLYSYRLFLPLIKSKYILYNKNRGPLREFFCLESAWEWIFSSLFFVSKMFDLGGQANNADSAAEPKWAYNIYNLMLGLLFVYM